MRRLIRPTPPACLNDGNDASIATRRAWHEDLYKQDGSIKDRWNSQDLDAHRVSSIRRMLESCSAKRCAWCEIYLEKGWHVDHWLPKTQFPWVAYCWDNLLPSCPPCNSRKSVAIP